MGGCQSECSKCIDEVGDYTGQKPSFIAMDPQNTCCSICLEGVQQEVDVNVDRDEISSDAETTPPDRDRGPGISAAGPFPIAGEKEPETALFIATQKRDGSDYWLRLDCGHVLHADCIQNRFRACVRKDTRSTILLTQLAPSVGALSPLPTRINPWPGGCSETYYNLHWLSARRWRRRCGHMQERTR